VLECTSLNDVKAPGRCGQGHGASDPAAASSADRPAGPEEIARTIYDALGIDGLQATDRDGRPFDLF
jgi:hypothetical protein